MEIIDFLSAFLSDPLTVIQDLIHQYDYLIYLILFLVVFAETGFVFMPLLPGDSLLFAIGVFGVFRAVAFGRSRGQCAHDFGPAQAPELVEFGLQAPVALGRDHGGRCGGGRAPAAHALVSERTVAATLAARPHGVNRMADTPRHNC